MSYEPNETLALAKQLVERLSYEGSERHQAVAEARLTRRYLDADFRHLSEHATKDGTPRSWYRRRIADAIFLLVKLDHESAYAQLIDALDNEPPEPSGNPEELRTAEPGSTAREEPSDEELSDQVMAKASELAGDTPYYTSNLAERAAFEVGRAFERRAALVAKDDPDKPGDYLRVREFSDGVKRPPWHEVIREDDIRCKSWKSSGYNYKDRWYGPFVIPEGEAGKP